MQAKTFIVLMDSALFARLVLGDSLVHELDEELEVSLDEPEVDDELPLDDPLSPSLVQHDDSELLVLPFFDFVLDFRLPATIFPFAFPALSQITSRSLSLLDTYL